MKKFLIFLLIPLFSFTQEQISDEKVLEQITEEKVINNIKDFFSALNVKNYDKITLNQKVTTDFMIYEMGDKFTLNEFTDFIESAGYLGWESTEWFLSDFTISIDSNSAHVSYLNTGVFIYPNPYRREVLLKEDKQWLESVLIVREDEDLKIKFLQSDEIYSKISVFKKSS
tara:strand:+ start:333 stop:845 length:513 start_codon:yes stop_codon:yes gene_type:complete